MSAAWAPVPSTASLLSRAFQSVPALWTCFFPPALLSIAAATAAVRRGGGCLWGWHPNDFLQPGQRGHPDLCCTAQPSLRLGSGDLPGLCFLFRLLALGPALLPDTENPGSAGDEIKRTHQMVTACGQSCTALLSAWADPPAQEIGSQEAAVNVNTSRNMFAPVCLPLPAVPGGGGR